MLNHLNLGQAVIAWFEYSIIVSGIAGHLLGAYPRPSLVKACRAVGVAGAIFALVYAMGFASVVVNSERGLGWSLIMSLVALGAPFSIGSIAWIATDDCVARGKGWQALTRFVSSGYRQLLTAPR